MVGSVTEPTIGTTEGPAGEHQRNDNQDKIEGDLRFRRSPNECHVGMGRFELPTPCSQSRCAGRFAPHASLRLT